MLSHGSTSLAPEANARDEDDPLAAFGKLVGELHGHAAAE